MVYGGSCLLAVFVYGVGLDNGFFFLFAVGFPDLCLLFFALSSIIGWGWYGELCWRYLFRARAAAPLYRLVFALLCLPGALGPGALLWTIADALNALMALPNLVSLLLLSGTAAGICRDYFAVSGKEPPRL